MVLIVRQPRWWFDSQLGHLSNFRKSVSLSKPQFSPLENVVNNTYSMGTCNDKKDKLGMVFCRGTGIIQAMDGI